MCNFVTFCNLVAGQEHCIRTQQSETRRQATCRFVQGSQRNLVLYMRLSTVTLTLTNYVMRHGKYV